MKIYHYPLILAGVRAITLGVSDKVLCAKQLGGAARLYVQKRDVPPEFSGPTTSMRKYACYPTGEVQTYGLREDHELILARPLQYIDTIIFDATGLVFHVYEVE